MLIKAVHGAKFYVFAPAPATEHVDDHTKTIQSMAKIIVSRIISAKATSKEIARWVTISLMCFRFIQYSSLKAFFMFSMAVLLCKIGEMIGIQH